MAQNYDLKLVVDADTSEAQRKLEALGGGTSGGGAAPSGTSIPSPSPAAQEAAERVRRFSLDQNDKPRPSSPDEFGKKAGDVAGKAIGKAIAGFLAHEVSTTFFNGLRASGGDGRDIKMAQSGVGGAIQYGTAGATVGGPVGGAVGALAGALMGMLQESLRQDAAAESRDNSLYWDDYRRNVKSAVSAGDSAFDRSLELTGSSRQRQEMIRARREEIERGSSMWSIKNLKEQLKRLDPESDDGKAVISNINMQRDRVAALDRQLLEEGLSAAPSMLDPGSVADSWAKRGVQIGAQVDVAQVNEKIMGEVQNCRTLLEKIANMANYGEIGAVGARGMINAVYN